DLSLEELMGLDAGQVYGASERLQPVTEAPASVSFITAEEIARFGYRTLADILRGVRGMYVSNDRNFSLMGARGFGKPGDYNSRILLLVNGHRVNDNVFGQAEIGAEFGMDPALFERVEIIRGPASSLYGDSAFLAVVNVITKTGASLNGGSLTLETGSLGTQLVRGSGGHSFPNGFDVAFSGTYENIDGVDQLYFPALDTPEMNNGVAEHLDGERMRQFYGRLAYKGLAVTSAYGARRKTVPTASFNSIFNEQDDPQQTTDRHTLVDAEYARILGATRVAVRWSFDRFTYDGIYPIPSGDPDFPKLVALNTVDGTRWTLGARLTRALTGNQTVTAGVEYFNNLRQNQVSKYVEPDFTFADFPRTSQQHALYIQDEVKLTRWLILNGGLRYDGYEDFTRVTPRTAVIVMPSPTQSFKYLFGSAFRAPSAYELNTAYFGPSVLNLRPESIDTHELVWERYTDDWLRTSLSGYWYKADRLLDLVPDPDALFLISYVNQGEVQASGVEFEAQMRLKWGWQAFTSYAAQRATDHETRLDLPNSPHHMAKGRVSIPAFGPSAFVSVESLFMSSRGTVAGNRVGPVGLVNVTLLQPLGRRWELVGTVRNLFDADYADPASSSHVQDVIPRNGRTARIGLRWKLWTK
ncbi:MAG: TonB-dependent receptor, partial [Acidobacteria bacterium]|nr:TonB-dependent receptor [Acidobacteriota bacterium]